MKRNRLQLQAIFGMDLLHTTLPNGTQSFRLSCDTRWQPVEAGEYLRLLKVRHLNPHCSDIVGAYYDKHLKMTAAT